MKRVSLALALSLALASPLHAEHLAPRNECRALEGAEEFQRSLVTAVANRNADMLRALVDPKVHLDFGGGHGWDEMHARLDSDQYELWKELDEVTRLGCARGHEDSLVMPYYWAQDIGERDPYGTYIVLGEDVPLHAAQDGEQVLRRLDWQYVDLMAYFELTTFQTEAARWEVRTADGTRGYVDRDNLRALIDYRLLADRREGKWLITAFIAGD